MTDLPLEPLSPVDAAWLRMDAPDNLMIIHSVMTFDEALDGAALKRLLQQRLLGMKRFGQRIVKSGSRYCWQDDPDFHIDNHVIEERLPEPGGETELRAFIEEKIVDPLPHGRPLWRLYLLTGAGGHSVIFWRLHHCIGDGIALMVVLLAMTDMEPDSGEAANPLISLFHHGTADADEVRAYLESMMPQGTKLMVRPSEMLAKANRWAIRAGYLPTLAKLTFRSRDNITALKGPLGVPKQVAWSPAIPMDDIRDLRERLGGTVNDVLLTAAAGGMRRYFQRIGHSLDNIDFRGMMPVSLRPLHEMADLGNRFGLIFLDLPVSIANPRERLEELRRRFGAMKHSLDPIVALSILGIVGRLPLGVQNLATRFFATKATAVVTSVPGPTKTLYVTGHPIRSLFFWVPQSARLGLGMSIGSYAGEVRLGVASDAGLVEDPAIIVEGFLEELAVMKTM